MQYFGHFLNSDLRGMLEEKDKRAVRMIFSIFGAYIDRAAEFRNEANMNGLYNMYSDVMSRVVSQNYGQRRYVAEPDTMCRDVCAFTRDVVNIILPVCTSGIFLPQFHLLDRPIEVLLSFGNLSARVT